MAKIICLVENESEIERVANHCGKSPASDEVCREKTLVSAEIAMKSTGFREIVADDCYHICFPKSCCVGKHALLVVSRWVRTNLTLTMWVK